MILLIHTFSMTIIINILLFFLITSYIAIGTYLDTNDDIDDCIDKGGL